MSKDTKSDRILPFEELHARAQEQLAYWIQGAVLEFTDELTEQMEAQDVNRTELARRAGVTPAYITKVLGGEGNFTLATMAKLSHALNSQVRLHLSPINTVTEWKDIPIHYARAIAWSPAQSGRVDACATRVRELIAESSVPKRQVESPKSEDHGRLTLAA